MSRGARWTLGFFALLFAAMFLYSERPEPSKSPLILYAFVVFCLLIAVACFSQTLRSPAVRIIGAMVFAVTVFYLLDELLRSPAKAYRGRSQTHWINAVAAFIVFGLPGLRFAIKGVSPPSEVESDDSAEYAEAEEFEDEEDAETDGARWNRP